ncbi:hypothetical protein [Prauserella alba]|uniref:hypothetical protein n=1 Tax=Prauserella alba TaxID=176898 RepID=UPI0020A45D13|nr:hypothetical protein [Prauserella alba]
MVIIIPGATYRYVDEVARQSEDAVHAAVGERTPVRTVLVDTSDPTDTRAREALLYSSTSCARHVVALPQAGWGAAVARGFRHALHLEAGLVIVADADTPTGEAASVGQFPLATAITTLCEQRLPGVVCSPVARPWWQRMFAAHALRPLMAPGLGLTLVDPQVRTLVLSPRAVQIALNPRWRLDTPGGHGLAVLTAARLAGMDVDQGPSRTPSVDMAQLAYDVGDLVDRDRGIGLLQTALATARLARAVSAHAVPPWITDLVPGNVNGHEVLDTALTHAAYTRAQTAPSGPTTPSAGDWPGPLIEAWHAARGLAPDLTAIASWLWDAYAHRVHTWLRTAVRLDAHPARLWRSVIAANTAFLTATATPIAPTTPLTSENHERHRLPHAS